MRDEYQVQTSQTELINIFVTLGVRVYKSIYGQQHISYQKLKSSQMS